MKVFDLSASLGLGEEDFPAFMKAAHEPAFLAALEPIPGARNTLGDWWSDGIRVDVITGRPPASRAATLEWLGAHRIPFDTLEFVEILGPPNANLTGYTLVIIDGDQAAMASGNIDYVRDLSGVMTDEMGYAAVYEMGMTNVFAVMRPRAAARSPSVWRDTSPRCHFHAIVRRSFGSIAVI